MAEREGKTARPDRLDEAGGKAAEEPGCSGLRPRQGLVARLLRRAFARPFIRHGYRVLMICMIMLALDRLDPVGSKSAADAMAHDVVMQAGNLIGVWPEHDRLRGSGVDQSAVAETWRADRPDGVTLVLWTDEAMSVMREEKYAEEIWPISYAAHAAALYEAREMQAKAIFLDFVFLSKRVDDTWGELAAEIRAFAGSSTPLFIACDLDWEGPPAFADMIDAVAAANAEAGKTVVSFVPAFLPVRPVIRDYDMWVTSARPITGLDSEELSGGLGRVDPGAQCGGAQVLDPDGPETVSMTVAPTLFGAAREKERPVSRTQIPSMSLFWDRRSHVVTRTLFAADQTETVGWWRNLKEMVGGILFDMSLLSRPMSGPPMMPAHFLVFPENPMDGTLATRDLIEGRVVVIGSAQSSAADVRTTPNAVSRPGALVHAVAVDNLFKFGLDYVRDRASPIGIDKSTAILIAAVFVSALAYSIQVERAPLAKSSALFVEDLRTGYRTRLSRSVRTGVLVFFIFSFVLIFYRFPPFGWFSSLVEFSIVAAPLALTWISTALVSVMYEHWDDDTEN
ncbi:MAG: CHASE2 domain-containing protein [Alphaproteobacteria bacterium]|nr:CHASE2 domain-containing protein [Alphaproteobacteria bacterium]